MKFEAIKAKAKLIFGGAIQEWPTGTVIGGPLRKGSAPAFEALLPFVLATKGERDEM